MPVEHSERAITLKHPNGSTADVLLYGATVISWRVAEQAGNMKEVLFVSSKAFLNGTKPVRGGIPVVFPCFGAPTHPDHSKLSQHGFARNVAWKFDSVVLDNKTGVSIKFTLDPIDHPNINSKYTRPFRLSYVVTLAAHQLSTDLHVTNTSLSDVLEFQALLHNYLRVPADQVVIGPLQSLSYYDKTETTEEARLMPKIETRAHVDVKRYTDSVYENAPLEYDISWPTGKIEIKATHFKDLVVWNPQQEGQKISDMEENGWKSYVCVEPGHVRGFIALEPQTTWIGQQVISVPKEHPNL